MLFKQLKETARALTGYPSFNKMSSVVADVIREAVQKQTGFEVIGDWMFLESNTYRKKNVGLVVPASATAADVARAEDVFIAAAKDWNVKINREDIPHYPPATTWERLTAATRKPMPAKAISPR
jgi:hypothetical protein